jgi:hypothetical protein
MINRNIFYAGVLIAGFSLFASCIQKNYYESTPTNNGNNNSGGNNNTSYYTYTFDEEFNGTDKYGWNFTAAADSAYASITGGNYQYVDYSAYRSNMSVVNTGADTRNYFSAKSSFKSNKTMGMLFGASATDNGYVFYIDTGGNYALYREGTATVQSVAIIPFTLATPYAVKNGWNTVEIDQANGMWTGYINGSKMFTITAATMSGSNCGFKILPGTIGYADYLQVTSY